MLTMFTTKLFCLTVYLPLILLTDIMLICSVSSLDVSQGSGSSFTEGTTRLTYIATDQASNSRRCDVYITVHGKNTV